MTLYFSYYFIANWTPNFRYIKWIPDVAVTCSFRFLYLVSMSSEEWVGKVQPKMPKMRNEFFVTRFCSAILPMASCMFREKLEVGVWIQSISRILFYILLISYVEIILETTISRFFTPRCTIFISIGEKVPFSRFDYGIPKVDGQTSLYQ